MSHDPVKSRFRAMVIGWYGAPNVGDEALLAVLVAHIHSLGGEVVVVSVDPALTRRMHGIEAVDYYNLGEIAGALLSTDVLIMGGGGIFDQHYPLHLRAAFDPTQNDIATYARPTLLARQFGIPVVIWGHGVGPLITPDARELIRHVFDEAAAISVRDEASADLLRDIGVTHDIVVAPDPGWLYARCCAPTTNHAPTVDPHAPRRRTLAVVLREWHHDPAWKDKLIAAFAQVKTQNWDVVWIAFQAGIEHSGAISDLATIEETRARVPAWAYGTMVTIASPAEAWAHLVATDAIVSMRLHASILGLSALKPIMGLEYAPKLSHAHAMANVPQQLRVSLDASAEHYAQALADLLTSDAPWAPDSSHIQALQDRAAAHLELLDACMAPRTAPLHWNPDSFDWLTQWLQQAVADLRALRADNAYALELLRYRDMVMAQNEAKLASTEQQLNSEIATKDEQLHQAQSLLNEHVQVIAAKDEQLHQAQSLLNEHIQAIAAKGAYIADKEVYIAQLRAELAISRSTRAQLAGLRTTARRVVGAPWRLLVRCRQNGLRSTWRSYRQHLRTLGQTLQPSHASNGVASPARPSATPVRPERLVVLADHLWDGAWPSRAAALACAGIRAGFDVHLWLSATATDTQGVPSALRQRLLTDVDLTPTTQITGTRILLASASPTAATAVKEARDAGIEVILDLSSLPMPPTDSTQSNASSSMASRVIARNAADTQALSGPAVEAFPDAGNNQIFDAYRSHPWPTTCKQGVRHVLLIVDNIAAQPIVTELERNLPNDQLLVVNNHVVENTHAHSITLPRDTELASLLAATNVVLVANGGQKLTTERQALVTAALLMGRRVVTDASHVTLDSSNLEALGERDWPTAARADAASEDYAFVARNCWIGRVEQLLRPSYPSSVSAIVLIHNNRNIIERCIATLLLHCESWLHEIIVVDNQSEDGGAELVEQLFSDNPKVKLVRNKENGCSSGRNLGVASSSGRYLAFFDSDQWLTSPACFAEAICLLQSHPDIGTVGWNAGWFDPTRDDLGGPISDYVPARGMNARALAQGYRDDIGFLGTSGMFMSRELFDHLDGFDTFYDPTCFEDTDLCFQIKQAGYKVVLRDLTGIRHQPHQTTGANAGSERYRKLFERNANYFRRKWAEHPAFFTPYVD